MSNRAKGNKFEKELCDILSKHGFWVHNFAQNKAGQPADIIAVREGRAFLIDCKDCDKEYFPFSRVEENQRLAMGYWSKCGNGRSCYFALKLPDGTVYMVNYQQILFYKIIRHRSAFGKKDFANFRTLDKWMEVFDCYSELETTSK